MNCSWLRASLCPSSMASASDRLPAIYAEFADSDGLLSYGNSLREAAQQVGIYAGRILKGVKPADLPVQQPTRFEMVINMRTARQLGLTIPVSVFARADEILE